MIDIQKIYEISSYFDEISFLTDSIYCCVCIIDIVNSTRITARIRNSQNIRKFYSIFINSIALEKNYEFKSISEYSTGMKQLYPIYSVNVADDVK
jgi:hypothetical protein